MNFELEVTSLQILQIIFYIGTYTSSLRLGIFVNEIIAWKCVEVSLILVSDSAIISGGLQHGVTIFSSLSIFLYKDLMLQCSKERSFDINLSICLTKSVCVAYCGRGSDRSLSEWLLLLVKHSQLGNNSALQCLQSFIYL